MKQFFVLFFVASSSLFANLVTDAQNEINVNQDRGKYELQSDCTQTYVAYANTTQFSEVSDCSGVTDNNHWIQSNDKAMLCTSSGAIGVEIPSATAILNPPAPIVLPTWDAGGKDYEYIYFDNSGNEVVTTYSNYCTTSISKDIDMALAEGEVNVQLGYQSYGPIEGYLQTFTGTAQVTYNNTCTVTDNTQWSIENNKAVICSNSQINPEVSLATKFIDNTPSTGCLEIQKAKYDAYKAQQESTTTPSSGNCTSNLNDAGLTINDINNPAVPSASDIESISRDTNEQFLKEVQKSRLLEYLIPLGYRYLPKIKEEGVRAEHVNSQLPQSNYGVFAPLKYGSSTGIEHKNTISKTELSVEDIQKIAETLLLLRKTELNMDNFSVVLPSLPSLNVYRLSATSGNSHGQHAEYPRPLTSTFSGGTINLSHDDLVNLYNNDRFQDPQGNFAMDLYFEGAGMGQVGLWYKASAYDSWHVWYPTMVLGGGAWLGSREGIEGVVGATDDWAIVRYTLSSIPYKLKYSLDDFAMFTAYEGFYKTTEFYIDTDFSIMKDSNGGMEKLNALLRRIYNYNKIDKTWNLGLNADGTPNAPGVTMTIDTLNSSGSQESRTIGELEALSYRLTGDEFADIINGVKNGVPKYIEEFKLITGYDLSSLPLFKFEFNELKKKYDFLFLTANSKYSCPSPYVQKTVVQTSNGPSKICVKVTDTIPPASYKFTYNPFENEKAVLGESMNRPADIFTFVDLYSGDYADEHNVKQDVVSAEVKAKIAGTNIALDSEKVEGVIGTITPNQELQNCVDTLQTTGYEFIETRNSKDGQLKETKTNFLKNPIRIYTHQADDIIQDALTAKIDSYATTVKGELNNLRPYMKDEIEDATIDIAIDRFKQTLDYQDIVPIYLPTTIFIEPMSSQEILSLSELLNQTTYSDSIFTNKPDGAIVDAKSGWEQTILKEDNILNNLYVNTIYVYNHIDKTEHTYSILNPVLVNEILAFNNGEPVLINKENTGIIYQENGQYVSTDDVITILEESTHFGFVATEIQRESYFVKLNFSTNFALDKTTILDSATANTDALCANAMYFDYEADRIIREKLNAWDLLVKKSLNYLSEVGLNTPDSDANSPYKTLYDAIVSSSMFRTINNRLTVATNQEKCDSAHFKVLGYDCRPGTYGRIEELRNSSGRNITGSMILDFVKHVAQNSPLISTLNSADSFTVNGKVENIEDLDSSIYTDVLAKYNVLYVQSSPTTTGGIHQYFPEVESDKDYSHDLLCPSCSIISFKNRSMVAQEVGNAIKEMQVAFHKRISGLIDFNAYEKCRNDLHSQGYADISRELFNPAFFNTNPENLTVSDATTFETTYQYNPASAGADQVTMARVKMLSGTPSDVTSFCNNVMRPTKFYSDSNIINTTMEKIYGMKKSLGAIIVDRYYENTYKDIWGDPNIFQAEICSSINVNTQTIGSSTEMLTCSNPIVPENGVDKNLIDIGIALFDADNGSYNGSSFPFTRGVLEFIDIYEMIQDNHTGNTQSMFGSLSLVQQMNDLGDYNKKDELETDYYNCLKFKAEVKVVTEVDISGNTRIYEVYPNANKYYSYKADICTETDTLSTPPAYIVGEYAHNGCPYQKDKMMHVRKCGDILNNNVRATSLANHTCADVELSKLTVSPLQEKKENYNSTEILQEGMDRTVDIASKKNAQLKQGVKKDITEDGHVTMNYSNSDAAITQVNTSGSADSKGSTTGSGNYLGSNSSFDSGMNRLKSQSDNASTKATATGGDNPSLDMSNVKDKQASAEGQINGLSSQYGASQNYNQNNNGQSGSYMDSATSNATGGSSVNEELNEQEILSKKVYDNSSTVDSASELDAEYNSGTLSPDVYSLDCTDCGGWNTQITEDDINAKKAEMDAESILTAEEKSSIIDAVDVNGEKKVDIIDAPRGSEDFSASDKAFADYYNYKDDNIRAEAGSQLSNDVTENSLGDMINDMGNASDYKDDLLKRQQQRAEDMFIQTHKKSNELNN